MSDDTALIELGCIGAPYGVRGWVKLRSYTDPPESLCTHRVLQLRVGGRLVPYRVEETGRSGGQLTAKLAGIADRDQAEALRGAVICVARGDLPPTKGKEYYRADLIGCEVVNLGGARLGVLRHFIESPGQVLMVITGSEEIWLPAVPQVLRRVDLAARRVTVDWPDEAG